MDNRRMNNNNQQRSQRNQMNQARNETAPHLTENSVLSECTSLAMAYVLWQRWQEVYPAEKALESGTLFPELCKPFLGRR